ncbi:MAG: hypothetical protein R3F48_07605 [Candidatus Zixiibacteriota bacterium]
MRVLTCFCLLLLFIVTGVSAQDLGIFEETTAGNYFGFGAKQMAMGGTGIANSIDGSALWYNPAGLARIPRIEFQLGMTHQKFSNETSMPAGRYNPSFFKSTINSADTDASKTRFSTVNLTIPVPTYRGAFVVSFGVHRMLSFDRVGIFHVRDLRISDDAIVDDMTSESESGSVYMYSGGAAIDLSPNLSVGAALNVFSGEDKFVYTVSSLDETLIPLWSVSYSTQNVFDLIAIGGKTGLLYRPNNRTSIGLTIETPIYWEIEQRFTVDDTVTVVKYRLIHPFKFGAGMAMRFDKLRLAAEATYADWSQLEYDDNPAMEQQIDSLSDLYRAVVDLRLGVEYQFYKTGLALRGGIFSQPLPYDDKFIIDDNIGFTLGFGWLLDKTLLLEGAYVDGGLERTFTAFNADYTIPTNKNAIAEDRYRRVYLTVSYRY